MASSGNFATMNPLVKTSNSMAYTIGNLRMSPSSNWSTTTWARGTMVIPSDKKIYFESRVVTSQGYHSVVGIGTNLSVPSGTNVGGDGSVTIYNDTKYVNGTLTNSFQGTVSNGDVYMVAVDGSNRKVWIGVNGTWSGSGDPANGTNEAGTVNVSDSLGYDLMPVGQNNSSGAQQLNFGQDSTFGGGLSAGGNADGNGFGDFKYSVPSGFLALCSANLSISEDIDPAETDDDYPGKQFGTITWTGDGTTSRAITGLGFQPDFIWFKDRTQAFSNRLYDTSRGIASNGGKRLFSNTTGAENDQTSGQDISAVGTDGFTLGASSANYTNYSSDKNVAWCWRANGGTTSSNSNGDITSTVQANTAAGFSIVTYTGNLTGSGNRTVGHGLSAAPEFIVRKGLNVAERWAVSHIGLTSFNYMLELNGYGAQVDKSGNGSMSAPTATVFSNNYTDGYAVNGTNYVAYCWHSVDGYSKFGKYEGNANADGIFVYTGFRPKMLFVKDIDRGENWQTFDTARNTFNPVDKGLMWNDTAAESTGSGSGFDVDFLSNGFKMRCTHDNLNGSSTYIYGAWGDVPFKYNNTF